MKRKVASADGAHRRAFQRILWRLGELETRNTWESMQRNAQLLKTNLEIYAKALRSPGAPRALLDDEDRRLLQHARDIVRFVDSGGRKVLVRAPKKTNLKLHIPVWTRLDTFGITQKLQRSKGAALPKLLQQNLDPNNEDNIDLPLDVFEAKRLQEVLQTYLKHFALRAPQVPPGMHVRPTYLYRGIQLWNDAKTFEMLTKKVYEEKGFAAMSLDKSVSAEFANGGGIVFRIRLDQISPGTPWIWLKAPRVYKNGSRTRIAQQHRNWDTSDQFKDESEVVLPPGKFYFSYKGRLRGGSYTLIDAIYRPAAEYALKKPRRRPNFNKNWNSHSNEEIVNSGNSNYWSSNANSNLNSNTVQRRARVKKERPPPKYKGTKSNWELLLAQHAINAPQGVLEEARRVF